MQAKAVVLVSGGLDSATVLAMAKAEGLDCYALSFDYGQRHRAELDAAKKIAESLGAAAHRVISIDLRQFGGSALTDDSIAVPTSDAASFEEPDPAAAEIPITYVPARNTVFLSFALAWSELLQAQSIHIGVNSVDYSGYPDCRREFIDAYQNMANLATKTGVEGNALTIETPLIDLTKADIVSKGVSLAVDYGSTVSCYQADSSGRACGKCDSCHIRRCGFEAAGIADPTRYVA